MASFRRFGFALLLGVLIASHTFIAMARDDILASAQGMNLTRRQVEDAIGFLEFLAGERFSTDERERIVAEARDEFQRDPAGDLRAYASVDQARQRLKALKGDAVKEAEFSEDTIAAIHLDLLTKPQKERESAGAKALFARVPVLAADPASRHVVTRRGLDALLDSNDFVAGLAGHGKLDAAARAKLSAVVVKAFPSLSADDRYVAAHGRSRWLRLQRFWSGLSPADRSTVVAELKQKAPKPENVPVAARQLETTARLALFQQHVNRSIGEIMRVQSGAVVLETMRNQSQSFGK